jgi:hypothetical protein
MFIGGNEDRHATIIETQSLFDAAVEPKEWWLWVVEPHTLTYIPTYKKEEKSELLKFLEKN